jgi:hypothetical protein
MRGHIVRTLGRVPVTWVSLRREPLKEVREVERHIRIGIFLNCQRPLRYFPRERVQSLASCAYL